MGLLKSSSFFAQRVFLSIFCPRFSVRPRDRFSVPTMVPGRAARSRRQGWPKATAEGGAERGLDDGEHGATLVGSGGASGRHSRSDRRGARLPRRTRKRSAATLYSGAPLLRVGDHDAVMRIGGEAPKGGPILQQRHNGQGRVRDTAASDRHRQHLARWADATERGYLLASSFSSWFAQPATGAGCNRMPSGTVPVVTNSKNATRSLRASATIMTLRVSRRWSAVRCRYHWTSALSG